MRVLARLTLLSLLVVSPSALAQHDYPNRPVTIVAPSAPGGLYSLFARIIGNRLEQHFVKPFIVENRPGASAIVGTMSVIRAPHDGHTLMIANNTGMAVNVTLRKELPYDPASDLVPIALIVRIPEVLVVNAGLPVSSVADIATLGRATPGGLAYGSEAGSSNWSWRPSNFQGPPAHPPSHSPRGIRLAENVTPFRHPIRLQKPEMSQRLDALFDLGAGYGQIAARGRGSLRITQILDACCGGATPPHGPVPRTVAEGPDIAVKSARGSLATAARFD